MSKETQSGNTCTYVLVLEWTEECICRNTDTMWGPFSFEIWILLYSINRQSYTICFTWITSFTAQLDQPVAQDTTHQVQFYLYTFNKKSCILSIEFIYRSKKDILINKIVKNYHIRTMVFTWLKARNSMLSWYQNINSSWYKF